MKEQVISSIIKNGVKNIQEFGYPNVNEDNIFTDFIYGQIFMKMLKENLGLGFDTEINHLIGRVNINEDSMK